MGRPSSAALSSSAAASDSPAIRSTAGQGSSAGHVGAQPGLQGGHVLGAGQRDGEPAVGRAHQAGAAAAADSPPAGSGSRGRPAPPTGRARRPQPARSLRRSSTPAARSTRSTSAAGPPRPGPVRPPGQLHGAARRPRPAPPIHRSILPPVRRGGRNGLRYGRGIRVLSTSDGELAALVCSPFAAETLSDPDGLVVVTTPDGSVPDRGVVDRLASLPCIVVAVARRPGDRPPLADATDGGGRGSRSTTSCGAVEHNPVAATALALCLRQAPTSLGAALVAESATYSLLQAGPGVRPMAGRPPGPRGPAGQRARRSRWNATTTVSRSS